MLISLSLVSANSTKLKDIEKEHSPLFHIRTNKATNKKIIELDIKQIESSSVISIPQINEKT